MHNIAQKQIAIITGASRRRGIGTAICRALAGDGFDIFFTHWSPYDRMMAYEVDEHWPQLLAEEIRAMGVRCESLAVDMSAADAPARILDAVELALGPPGVLVNNAAHSTRDGYQALDAQTLDAHYAVNIRGTLLLSVEFARRYGGETARRIISMTSGQSLGPMPGELAYIATKGAIEAFTLTLSAELAPKQITVNAVDPGGTDTGWMTDEIKCDLLPHFPLGRVGQPEDAARLVAFLASDAAQWITGQIIHSRGGS